jgi:hypothetical protein
VTVSYLLDSGAVVNATHTIAANGRLSINPEADPPAGAALVNATFDDHLGRADCRGAFDVLGRQGAAVG